MKELILQQDNVIMVDYAFNIAGTLAIASALFFIIYSNFFKDYTKNQMVSNGTINTFDLLTQRKELQQYLLQLLEEDSKKNRTAVKGFGAEYVQYAIWSRNKFKSGRIYCEASSGDFNKTVVRSIAPNYSLLLKNVFSKNVDYKSNLL